jgi:hypothetical protein
MQVLAGSGRSGFPDGAGAAAHFDRPSGVAVDGEDNVIVVDYDNHRVRKIAPDGTVSTLAGCRSQGFARLRGFCTIQLPSWGYRGW